MSCNLDKYKTYNVGQVHYDRAAGKYTVGLLDTVPTCPGGVFASKKAKLVVNAESSPSLGFSLVENKPVITVPNEAYVINYGSSFSFEYVCLSFLGLMAAFFVGRWVYRKLTEWPAATYDHPVPVYANSGGTYYPSSSGSGTTVINNNNSPDLLTTVLVADALSHSHGSSNNTTTIIERERVVERESSGNSYQSDDSSSSDSSYSSDDSSDSSYSSDSSSDSSYSSDSSDSGSSFGSDS